MRKGFLRVTTKSVLMIFLCNCLLFTYKAEATPRAAFSYIPNPVTVFGGNAEPYSEVRISLHESTTSDKGFEDLDAAINRLDKNTHEFVGLRVEIDGENEIRMFACFITKNSVKRVDDFGTPDKDGNYSYACSTQGYCWYSWAGRQQISSLSIDPPQPDVVYVSSNGPESSISHSISSSDLIEGISIPSIGPTPFLSSSSDQALTFSDVAFQHISNFCLSDLHVGELDTGCTGNCSDVSKSQIVTCSFHCWTKPDFGGGE